MAILTVAIVVQMMIRMIGRSHNRLQVRLNAVMNVGSPNLLGGTTTLYT